MIKASLYFSITSSSLFGPLKAVYQVVVMVGPTCRDVRIQYGRCACKHGLIALSQEDRNHPSSCPQICISVILLWRSQRCNSLETANLLAR